MAALTAPAGERAGVDGPEPAVATENVGSRRDGRRIARQVSAEALGTFFLTLIAGGGEIVAVLHPGEVGTGARAVAPALVVLVMIFAAGDVSGAHFNPVVSLAFALRRVFPWQKVPVYWVAQLVGAVTAALVLRWMFGLVSDLGATHTHVSDGRAVGVELILTALLVTVILNTANRHSLIGTDAALAVGATIALCGLVGLPLTGASMNPARSVGPMIASGNFPHAWVFVVGPALGAIVGAAIAYVLHPRPNEDEHEAADGEPGA